MSKNNIQKKKPKWKDHKAKWGNCEACELCETRKNIVLAKARGTLPTDILFVGEAPGRVEDRYGKPFVGPAGHLLDEILEEVIPSWVKLAFTNIISCIPLDENGQKVKQPHREHIKACKARLVEFYHVARPQYLVSVGKLAEKHIDTLLKKKEIVHDEEYITSIIHPAAILRAVDAQQGIMYKRNLARLHELLKG